MTKALLSLRQRKHRSDNRSWHGAAFIMEALVLLLFLVVSMAILIQLFGSAKTHDDHATELNHAVTLASNEAERFNVNPSSNTVNYYRLIDGVLTRLPERASEGVFELPGDAFTVKRNVSSEVRTSGTLYRATILIEHYGSTIYELHSATYDKDEGVSS